MSNDAYSYVGQQAIFDRRMRVVGYELLYRNSDENRARFDDVNEASAATMVNAYLELGLDVLAPGVPVWVNLPEDFLVRRLPLPLPAERTVIEVLEDVPVTPELLSSLAQFRAEGYKIALDDFVLTDATRPLVPLASWIKIDVLNVARDEIERQYRSLERRGPTLLAEKISTHDEHQFLRDLGFELFQGHFLEMPIISKAKRLPHNHATLVRILASLYDPKLDLRSIETLLAPEVGLSVRLIRLASSVAMSSGGSIGSIREAVQRIGLQQVAALVMLIVVSGFDDKPLELARQALIRARMCEVLARQARLAPDQLFTAGLLSLVDAILDRPLPELVSQLGVAPLVREALQGGSTPAAKIIETVKHQSRGDLAPVGGSGLSPQAVFIAWFDAVRWADELIAKV